MATRASINRVAHTFITSAWVPMPTDDPWWYGYVGEGALKAARQMRDLIHSSVELNQQMANTALKELGAGSESMTTEIIVEIAYTTWHDLAKLLYQHYEVDVNPRESRIAISEPLRQLYIQYSKKFNAYPAMKKVYLALGTEVDTYFSSKV